MQVVEARLCLVMLPDPLTDAHLDHPEKESEHYPREGSASHVKGFIPKISKTLERSGSGASTPTPLPSLGEGEDGNESEESTLPTNFNGLCDLPYKSNVLEGELRLVT